MSLTDSQVKSQKAGPRRRNVSVGNSLILVIESESWGGGKFFEARMRFPPGRKGKQVPVRIGVYGKGIGKWSLREAKEEWDRIRAWSREKNKDPRELKMEEQQDQVQQSPGPTFAEACASYLRNAKTKASQKEYPNLLNNQVIPRLGADTPVWHLSWDHEGSGGKKGRERVMEVFGTQRFYIRINYIVISFFCCCISHRSVLPRNPEELSLTSWIVRLPSDGGHHLT